MALAGGCMATTYDIIGKTYARKRQADPRIALAIERTIRGCTSVLNVGAGTGSYEPRGCQIIAVEPSSTMIGQRPASAAPVVQARAEALPFPNRSFDAVLGVLTLHHWGDEALGIAECLRVARDRVVYLTVDPEVVGKFWLFDYLPELWIKDQSTFSSVRHLAEFFDAVEVLPVPIPADCRDGFLGAYWKRPTAYLDPSVRANISTFSKFSADELKSGLSKLQADIEAGEWHKKYPALNHSDELDLGYRLHRAPMNQDLSARLLRQHGSASHLDAMRSGILSIVYSRLIAAALLLVTVLQVPGLAYSTTLNGGVDQSHHVCDNLAADDQNCDSCCSQGMTSCAAQCLAPTSAAMPLTLPPALRIAARGIVIIDAGLAPFAQHISPHLLRPPIV